MSTSDFHEKPFDEGTLSKLKIFELYTQEWIPVFLSSATPSFSEVHIFDFFCGPGTDCKGIPGSPLRILDKLQCYHKSGLAGWDKVKIVVHLFDEDHQKVDKLAAMLKKENWDIPGVSIDLQAIKFHDALTEHRRILENGGFAKLLIIDQCGVDEVSEVIFRSLIQFLTTDFIFFIASSTLNRFHNHPAIKQKIVRPEDFYDVHRAAFDSYKKLVPANSQTFLGRFSIKKSRNIYGLIFGSGSPLGIDKFLEVVWKNDPIVGEANFDIERENINPDQGMLPIEDFRPEKSRVFEAELEREIRSGKLLSEAAIIRFCFESGMRRKHAEPVIKKLKAEKIIDCNFRVPNVRRYYKDPRPIRVLKTKQNDITS